jgi:hypothetical protein
MGVIHNVPSYVHVIHLNILSVQEYLRYDLHRDTDCPEFGIRVVSRLGWFLSDPLRFFHHSSSIPYSVDTKSAVK